MREPSGLGRRIFPSLLSVLLSLAVCFAVLAAMRGSIGLAAQAYLQMLWGGLGDFPRFLDGGGIGALTRPWGEAATKAALLTLTGLSVAVAFKVGLFNIGAQGQLEVGALVAAVLGASLSLPGWLHPWVCALGAAVAGGLYGLIPAALKLRRGVHEVISTIMLNWIAISLVENWLVVGPLRANASGDNSLSGTSQILPTAELPRLLGELSRLNGGFVLALMLAALCAFWLMRTRNGFEVRAVGMGMEASRAAGIPVSTRVYQAMALSGALAGLAGGVLVLGTEHRFPPTLGGSYGFDGIAIALIGQAHPAGVVAAALGFGLLRAGGPRLQLIGVHQSFPELIQGLALLLIAGRQMWNALLARVTSRVGTPDA